MAVTRYFLGGNTARGFVSFYDGFCRGPEDFLWVIKGGPGCGKSSFMKTIGRAAEDAGLDTEYVLCSGDPDSVDGVYIPAWHTGYADGTAPHVIEAVTPGAAGLYLDLGQFYDRIALQKERRAIEALQRRAYRRGGSAGSCAPSRAEGLFPPNRPWERCSWCRRSGCGRFWGAKTPSYTAIPCSRTRRRRFISRRKRAICAGRMCLCRRCRRPYPFWLRRRACMTSWNRSIIRMWILRVCTRWQIPTCCGCCAKIKLYLRGKCSKIY